MRVRSGDRSGLLPAMVSIPALTRRTVLASSGALAAGACTHAPDQPPRAPDLIYKGLELPSESVHSGVSSADGQQRLTIRICRYPTMGKAWLWVHARTPRGVFSFVDHLAPSGSEATPVNDTRVRYADTAERLVFEREGPSALPTACTVSARVPAIRSATSRFGEGAHDLSARIDFRPARAYSGLNPGRTEVFGTARAELDVAGQTLAFEGPAQFHEQRQSQPRFITPFAYITLWSAGAGATLLVTPRRADGYLLDGAASNDAALLRLDPPGGATRRIAVRLSDGRTLEGEARVTAPYTLPLYGETWRGHFVSATLGDRRFEGNINDFLPDQLPYPAGA
jgi:hypothetical protein